MKRGNIYEIIPVELTSFTASANENDVQLSWSTATETNNYGFEIERQISSKQSAVSKWETIGFIPGYGTSTEKHFYSFSDENLNQGNYQYRLKQIDFDGTSSYSDIVEVAIHLPARFALEQNYPNPFNPSTKIKYSIPQSSIVVLKIFDVLGNEIETLVNEEKPTGTFEIVFDAGDLPSGVYFYELKSESFLKTKKMLLLK
ncbi:MAG: T9SS type A sorting domain-containing protein [Ignavibacteriaceae bacterium]|nr:T9SS type A sorting domain-containing protein [Ignavibacteriaceae bacterium]